MHIIYSILVFMFVYAAFSKLLTLEAFRIQLGQSPLLTRWAPLLLWFVPLTELAVSLLLIFPTTRLLGLYGSLFLMAVFTTYIFVVLHFSPFIPCSCGGILEDMTWGQHLLFNIFFLLISFLGIMIQPKQSKSTIDIL